MTASHDHWNDHARQWQKLGPPLRPGVGDVLLAEKLVAEASGTSGGAPFQAILLGVTPELAVMHWPSGTRLLAIDRCQDMIQKVWPRCPAPATVVCADWRTLPVSDATVDVVLGDGCYTQLENPEAYKAVSAEVMRALKPTGRFIMRFFVQPDRAESPEAVFTDLENGRIGNFHILKWRLAMSLQECFAVGVRLGDIWEAWHAEGIDADALSQRMNWPLNAVASIDAYRNVDTRYTFPTLAELRACLSDYFAERSCFFPDYELGDRCPTLTLSPRSR